jgi:hypothetical protein
MIPAHVETSLSEVELRFSEVAAALVSGEPVALEAASTVLRQAAIDFSTLLQSLSPSDRQNKELTLRLKKIADGTATLKDGLFRRSAMVDMALKTMVPATQQSTYANTGSPYGSAGKPSGAFKYLSA